MTNANVVLGVFATSFFRPNAEDAAMAAEVIKAHNERTGLPMKGEEAMNALFADGKTDPGPKFRGMFASWVKAGMIPGVVGGGGPTGGYHHTDVALSSGSAVGSKDRSYTDEEKENVRQALRACLNITPKGVSTKNLATALGLRGIGLKNDGSLDPGYLSGALAHLTDVESVRPTGLRFQRPGQIANPLLDPSTVANGVDRFEADPAAAE